MDTRRRLIASALPLLMVAAVPRLAAAEAPAPCTRAKSRFAADDGAGGCPHCAALSKGRRRTGKPGGDIPAPRNLF